MVTGRWLRIWHRRLGLTAAAFVLLLSVTGLLLNHASSLDLDNRKVENSWILNWYGVVGVDETARAFDVGGLSISWAGGWLFLDEKPLIGGTMELKGAVTLSQLIILATPREFLLFTDKGELVERFPAVEFGAEIQSIGSADDRLAVRAGEELFSSNSEVSSWSRFEAGSATISWSTSVPLTEAFVPAMDAHLRGEGLPLYRIVLDLHSGNFFGELGRWMMDAAAVLLLILSVSGIWIWWPRAH
ncbi:MAG: PepSY domain-containing protein [Rhodobiaceae bacterium]|nr:PepSY domain-containing protein [Rhodobiaceae bacterium]